MYHKDCYIALANNDYTAKLVIDFIMEVDDEYVWGCLEDYDEDGVNDFATEKSAMERLAILEAAGIIELEPRHGMLMVIVPWIKDKVGGDVL